jgi:hypothetical protein
LAKYSDSMATYTGAVTGSYQTMTGSPYAPLKSGRLKKLKLLLGGSAATALIDGTVTVRVTNPAWGVPATVSAIGAGLQTATCAVPPIAEQEIDLPVTIGSNLTCEILLDTGSTPVTPRIRLIGEFE